MGEKELWDIYADMKVKKVLFELRECFSELVGEYTTQEIYDEIDHKLKELGDN